MVSNMRPLRIAVFTSLAIGVLVGCASLAGVEPLVFRDDDEEAGPRPDATADVLVPMDGTAPPPDPTLVGIFENGTFFLARANEMGTADLTVHVDASANAIPFAHHKAGERDLVGWYEPITSTFYLVDSNDDDAGASPHAVQFGGPNQGAYPVVGDWDGDGTATIGFYVPSSGAFFLKNSNDAGDADIEPFTFGLGGLGYLPMAGDWPRDAGGKGDRVGLYLPSTGDIFLRWSLANGTADKSARIAANPNVNGAVAGNWVPEDDYGVSAGVYDPVTANFTLVEKKTAASFQFGPLDAGSRPLAGRWKK